MKPAILVDTSVWINFFNGTNSPQVNILTSYIEDENPIYVNPTIIQEVLQGVRSDQQYKKIKESLLALNVLNDNALEMAISSAKLYRSLRKKGITIRGTADVIIATFCIEHQLPLLFSDRDFLPFTQHLGLVSALAKP